MDFAGSYLFEPIPCTVRAAWEKGKWSPGSNTSAAHSWPAGCFLTCPRCAETWQRGWKARPMCGFTDDAGAAAGPLRKRAAAAAKPASLGLRLRNRLLAGLEQPSPGAVPDEPLQRPSRPRGKDPDAQGTGQTVTIYNGPQLLATHPRCYEKYRVIENPEHYAGLLAKRKKARAARRVEEFWPWAPCAPSISKACPRPSST